MNTSSYGFDVIVGLKLCGCPAAISFNPTPQRIEEYTLEGYNLKYFKRDEFEKSGHREKLGTCSHPAHSIQQAKLIRDMQSHFRAFPYCNMTPEMLEKWIKTSHQYSQ